MTERDFTAEIADVEHQMNALLGPMAQAAEAWLQTVIPWAQRFWADVIHAIIQEPHNAVKLLELPEASLQSVRWAADAVTQGAEDYLRRTLIEEVPADWPHLKPQTTLAEFATQSSFRKSPFGARNRTGPLTAPSPLSTKTRHALGVIAPPFAAAGLTPPPSFRPHHDRWEVSTAPDWTPEMCEAIDHYGELHIQLIELIKLRATLLHEQRVHAALTRWDAAG